MDNLKTLLRKAVDIKQPYAKICFVRELTPNNTCTVEDVESPNFNEDTPNQENYYYEIKYSPSPSESVTTPAVGSYVFVTLFNSTDGFISQLSNVSALNLGGDAIRYLAGGALKVGDKLGVPVKDNTELIMLTTKDRFLVDVAGDNGLLDFNNIAFRLFGSPRIYFSTKDGAVIDMDKNIKIVVGKEGKIKIGKTVTRVVNKYIKSDKKEDNADAKFLLPKTKPVFNGYIEWLYAFKNKNLTWGDFKTFLQTKKENFTKEEHALYDEGIDLIIEDLPSVFSPIALKTLISENTTTFEYFSVTTIHLLNLINLSFDVDKNYKKYYNAQSLKEIKDLIVTFNANIDLIKESGSNFNETYGVCIYSLLKTNLNYLFLYRDIYREVFLYKASSIQEDVDYLTSAKNLLVNLSVTVEKGLIEDANIQTVVKEQDAVVDKITSTVQVSLNKILNDISNVSSKLSECINRLSTATETVIQTGSNSGGTVLFGGLPLYQTELNNIKTILTNDVNKAITDTVIKDVDDLFDK